MKKENSSRVTNQDNCKDTGMALALLCVLLAYYGHHPKFMPLAVFILVIDMVWPNLFFYPAKAWFGFAHLMGTVTSRVVLTLLFYGLVTPIGVLRRTMGADLMQSKHWKNGMGSVFKTREHTYTTEDIERPY